MGLLDDGMAFIKTPEGQGLLSGLFGYAANAHRGTPINNIGRGGMAGLIGYSNAQDRQIQDDYKTLQMETIKRQNADALRRNQLIDQFFGGGAKTAGTGTTPSASAPTAPVQSPVFTPEYNAQRAAAAATAPQPQTPVPGPRTTGLSGMTPDQLARLKLGAGIDLVDVYKLTRPDMQVSNGYAYDKNTVQPGFLPGINTSQDGKSTLTTVQNGMPQVQAAPGSLEAFTRFEDAKNASQARNKPIKVYNAATGREEYRNEAEVAGGGNNGPVYGVAPAQAQAVPGIPGNGTLPAPLRNNNPGALMPGGKLASYSTPEAGIAALDANLQSYGKQGVNTVEGIVSKWAPQSAGNNTSAYIDFVSKALNVKPNQPLDMSSPYVRHGLAWSIMQQENGRNALVQPGNGQGQRTPFAAGPSFVEQAQAEATKRQATVPVENQGKINDTWLKTSYEPVVASGSAANEVLTNIGAARIPLGNMQTGWGTEAKGYAANVLTSLGIGGANAKMYATNVQQFQNVAMSQLKTSLDAAKGPQTEGDADRTSKLWSQLSNTPDANAFILDLAQAKAQRDVMRSKFYQGALPIARDKGNLQELDTEWSRRSPSIFDMPSMQKWGAKK